nr:Acyl-coenzyme A thioesterase 9, mitochondrial [Ipomoea batatas]
MISRASLHVSRSLFGAVLIVIKKSAAEVETSRSIAKEHNSRSNLKLYNCGTHSPTSPFAGGNGRLRYKKLSYSNAYGGRQFHTQLTMYAIMYMVGICLNLLIKIPVLTVDRICHISKFLEHAFFEMNIIDEVCFFCNGSKVSNKFYFTFSVCSDALENGLRIRSVVPATEEEARRVIERMDAEKCC